MHEDFFFFRYKNFEIIMMMGLKCAKRAERTFKLTSSDDSQVEMVMSKLHVIVACRRFYADYVARLVRCVYENEQPAADLRIFRTFCAFGVY